MYEFKAMLTMDTLIWAIDNNYSEQPDDEEFIHLKTYPIDKDMFNVDLNNWMIEINQHLIPKWFDPGRAEQEMQKMLKEIFDSRYIVNEDAFMINKGRWFIKNSGIDATKMAELYCYGESSVTCGDYCRVSAYDKTRVFSFDSCAIKQYDESSSMAHDRCHIKAYDTSTVNAYNMCIAELNDRCVCIAYDNTRIVAGGCSRVDALRHSYITASEYCSVKLKDYAILVASDRVQVEASGRNYIDIKNGSNVITDKIDSEVIIRR